MSTRCHGFSLLETLIATALIGILTSFAVPNFESQLHRARRAEVLVAAALIQAAQERVRGYGPRYGNLSEIGVAPTTAHYALQLTDVDANGYVLLATATGAQARDTSCRFMQAHAIGMTLTYSSGGDARLANDAAANRRCWSQ